VADRPLWLRYEGPRDGGHNDLVLTFGSTVKVTDSYYIYLDTHLEGEGLERVRAGLRLLLAQWLEAIRECRGEKAAYLPYDFSDQYTGWVGCSAEGEALVLTLGSADVEGFAIYPSDISAWAHSLASFRPDP